MNFKPRPWLEFGLTRTAQWCGGDRPCDWDTFVDMVLGNDNQVEGGGRVEDQPGNQMAGYDMRLRSPWRALPLAFYTQWIGEDEAGGLPSKFIGQFGLESWGSSCARRLAPARRIRRYGLQFHARRAGIRLRLPERDLSAGLRLPRPDHRPLHGQRQPDVSRSAGS